MPIIYFPSLIYFSLSLTYFQGFITVYRCDSGEGSLGIIRTPRMFLVCYWSLVEDQSKDTYNHAHPRSIPPCCVNLVIQSKKSSIELHSMTAWKENIIKEKKRRACCMWLSLLWHIYESEQVTGSCTCSSLTIWPVKNCHSSFNKSPVVTLFLIYSCFKSHFDCVWLVYQRYN